MLKKFFFRAAIISLLFAVSQISCKRDDIFVDPAYVFMKWSHAIKTLNYNDYYTCEAYPKTEDVFRELYGNYYYSDLITRGIGTYNEKDTSKDIYGRTYTHRMVYFECQRVNRKTDKVVEYMKGEVEFIQYVQKPNSDRGWLMYNRTIIRAGADEK